MSDHSVKIAELLSLWSSYTQFGGITWKYQCFRNDADRILANIKGRRIYIDRILKQDGSYRYTLHIDNERGESILVTPTPNTSADDVAAMFFETEGTPPAEFDKNVEKTLDHLLAP